ncbi:Uncharacterized protein XB16_0358 [Leptospira santarosai]|uniref:Uncharacterized protein n=1 Tax=Leptospira santarosai TaxID=28183 RepID=A0A2P1QP89_9LEPT|nr:Uncharacterized protein XB16_0358 [Leptospira santarosai]
MMKHSPITTSGNNTGPTIFSEIENHDIAIIADAIRERFPTFDWRRNDHREMTDKEVAAIFFIKKDIAEICGNDLEAIREFMSDLEYIFDEEFGE